MAVAATYTGRHEGCDIGHTHRHTLAPLLTVERGERPAAYLDTETGVRLPPCETCAEPAGTCACPSFTLNSPRARAFFDTGTLKRSVAPGTRCLPVGPRAVITTDRPLSATQAEQILAAFEARHRDPSRPILLHSGLRYEELPVHQCAHAERCAYCTSRLFCSDRHCQNCGAPA